MPAIRTRRRRASGNEMVDNLNNMINELIVENRKLRRQVDKLNPGATGATSRVVERGLKGIQRRLQNALTDGAVTSRRRRTSTVAATTDGRRARAATTTMRARRPVSPEVAEKRRAALEKARAARAAKREAAAPSE